MSSCETQTRSWLRLLADIFLGSALVSKKSCLYFSHPPDILITHFLEETEINI